MVELTTKLFVELTLEMLPKLISKLADAVAKHKEELENAAGPEEMMQVVFGIILDLRSEIGEDLLPEGITSEDMETFKQEHEVEIQEYIESDPKIKKRWDNLQEDFEEKFQQIMQPS
ncbi:MAG TPA: hypothetical protein VMV49_00990 [Candidatus Deferrimicrobium sp.]|nr:hypothetical protein [Candidatus Deferrimicrobium sp.]